MANFEQEELFKESLLYKVAWLYYIDEMTQKDIADMLSISRIKVIKMLEEARRRKIVQFHFSTYFRNKNDLETSLIEKYNLKDVLVVPWSVKENLAENLGQATAMYLNDFLQDGETIGVGYGVTIGAILKNLAKISNKQFSIISMTGGVMPYVQQIGSRIFNLQPYLIPAPLIVSKKEIADIISKEKAVKDIFELARTTKVVVTGIGGMTDNPTVLHSELLTEQEFTNLKSEGAVGDILMHFFDKRGELVDSDVESRIISTKLDDVKEKENIIAVAGGHSKLEAIHTALSLGFVNVLITDEATAESLLGGENFD